MSGVNKWIGVGFCGRDGELKYSQSGSAILSISIAVTEAWFDKNSNEKKERTEWVSCTMFGSRAEAVSKFVTKGKQIYVEGRLRTRSWDDKETGKKVYKTEVVVSDLLLLGSGSGKRERQDERREPSHGSAGDGSDSFSGDQSYDESSIPF